MRLMEYLMVMLISMILFYIISYEVSTAEPKSLSSYYTEYIPVHSVNMKEKYCEITIFNKESLTISNVSFENCPPVKVGQKARFTVEFQN